MAIGPPPDVDVARVRRWCRAQVPADVRDKLRIECDVSGRDVVIVERRPPWGPEAGPEWTTTPVALLRYLKSRRVWRLYWRGSDERWHEYPELPFSASVEELLHELDRDPTALFWG
jgi:hypothetical protein